MTTQTNVDGASIQSIVMQPTVLEKVLTPKVVCEAWKVLLEIECARWKMPEVPTHRIPASEIIKMQDFSGIYFAWDGLFVSYVGKSRNIPHRVRSHEKFCRYNTMLSFLEIPESEIGLSEIFYIWLLRPELNSETWSA